MKAARLERPFGRAPDADHHFGAGRHRGDERSPAETPFLGHGQAGREHRRARMGTRIRIGQIVHFERVRHRAVRECRRWRMHARAAGAENGTLAARAAAPGVGNDDPAPGKLAAEEDDADGVGDAVLDSLPDRSRDIVVVKRRGVLGEARRVTGFALRGSRACRFGRLRGGCTRRHQRDRARGHGHAVQDRSPRNSHVRHSTRSSAAGLPADHLFETRNASRFAPLCARLPPSASRLS